MQESIITKMHNEYKATGRFTLPDHLKPPQRGYSIVAWARELVCYYRKDGQVVRPFDELPPLKLSLQEDLAVTIQDVHRFIVSDLNLIPMETRRQVLEQSLLYETSADAWEAVRSLLIGQLEKTDDDLVVEDLSWKFSPVAELLWAVTWVFMEREKPAVPASVRLASDRFPYYCWSADGQTYCMWEPESTLCRREWLAMDVYKKIMETGEQEKE